MSDKHVSVKIFAAESQREHRHGQSPASQAPLDLALFSRRPERHRRRVPVLQLRYRSRPPYRGDGALEERRAALPESPQLPAREHRDAYGGGFCDGNGPRTGGDGGRERGGGEFRGGGAQRPPRPAAPGGGGGGKRLYPAGAAGPAPRQTTAP